MICTMMPILSLRILLNVAAFVETIHEEDDPLPTFAKKCKKVRQAERSMQDELLNLYKFYDNTVTTTPLELTEYRRRDPFDKTY